MVEKQFEGVVIGDQYLVNFVGHFADSPFPRYRMAVEGVYRVFVVPKAHPSLAIEAGRSLKKFLVPGRGPTEESVVRAGVINLSRNVVSSSLAIRFITYKNVQGGGSRRISRNPSCSCQSSPAVSAVSNIYVWGASHICTGVSGGTDKQMVPPTLPPLIAPPMRPSQRGALRRPQHRQCLLGPPPPSAHRSAPQN